MKTIEKGVYVKFLNIQFAYDADDFAKDQVTCIVDSWTIKVPRFLNTKNRKNVPRISNRHSTN